MLLAHVDSQASCKHYIDELKYKQTYPNPCYIVKVSLYKGLKTSYTTLSVYLLKIPDTLEEGGRGGGRGGGERKGEREREREEEGEWKEREEERGREGRNG